MKENLIPQIAKMLGVEIGEEFVLDDFAGFYRFFENKLECKGLSNEWKDSILTLNDILSCNIEKLPQKPKLTEAERVILENLPKEFKWIVRTDSFNVLLIYTNKPERFTHYWFKSCGDISTLEPFKHLFQFIKWEDKEPYNIQELLGE